MSTKKTHCWEFIKCGEEMRDNCPAYPDFGRNCWTVAGTWCGDKIQGIVAKTIANCVDCEFYQLVEKELEEEQKKLTGESKKKD